MAGQPSTVGLSLVSLIVRSYDDAIEFFVSKLGFTLIEDSPAVSSVEKKPKRWVVVQPPSSTGCSILLAQADGAQQEAQIGNQFAGRVGFFWHVEDFEGTYKKLQAADVEFLESPRKEAYGQVVIFRDICGNKWDLIGTAKHTSPE